MAKSPAAEFEQDLEGIFEDRAAEFSPELRQLLKQLWEEGIGRGRLLERNSSLQLHVLKARSPAPLPTPQAEFAMTWEDDAITSDELAVDITLGSIKQALSELPSRADLEMQIQARQAPSLRPRTSRSPAWEPPDWLAKK